MVRPLFRERIRQPGHAPILHTDGEVSPFDMGRASLVEIRFAAASVNVDAENFAGRVPMIVFEFAVVLDDDGMIHWPIFTSENCEDGGLIRLPSVGVDLESAARVVLNLVDEHGCIDRVALAEMPGENQLCLAFDRAVAIRIADPFIGDVLFVPHLLFHLNEAPDFIGLDILGGNSLQANAKELFTFLADAHEQGHDRSLGNASGLIVNTAL